MNTCRKSDCGICGTKKVERRGRLVCQTCQRRYAKERAEKIGPQPSTAVTRATKAKYRNTKRVTGLTNGQVSALKKRYGIGEGLYLKIRQKHRDCCGICDAYIPKSGTLDHNHKTKAVRGLLCRACNMAIGLMAEDPERLREAARYIERNGVLKRYFEGPGALPDPSSDRRQ